MRIDIQISEWLELPWIVKFWNAVQVRALVKCKRWRQNLGLTGESDYEERKSLIFTFVEGTL